jgi:dihydrofolate synthase/folylpolyglutamate synthase
VAVTAAKALLAGGMTIDDSAIRAGLLAASIPGRAESIPGRVPVLLDGAHNQDKITALAMDLPALLPVTGGGKRIAVIGALEAKHVDALLSILTPHLDTIIATSPRVLAKTSKAAGELAAAALEQGFPGLVISEPDPVKAIEQALGLADATRGDAILVTGSLYLVGNIREQWYRSDDIVLSQSSWPKIASPVVVSEVA